MFFFANDERETYQIIAAKIISKHNFFIEIFIFLDILPSIIYKYGPKSFCISKK